MGNQALQKNPPTSDLHISTHGSDWLWTVFAIMLLSDLIMIWWAYRRPRGTRVFHHLSIIILTTAAISYFAMASDLGSTPIPVQFTRGRASGTTRAIWYARYIDWVITTPLLLLTLLLATGLSLSDIVTIIFMDLVMIVSGLLGALVRSSYKWGFYAFGLAALVYIWTGLFRQGRRGAGFFGTDTRGPFLRGAGYLSFIWMLYPVCWALSEGGNVISPTGEMVFYGVLDLMSKPVFCFAHLWALRNYDMNRFGLSSGKATEAGMGSYGAQHVGQHEGMTGVGSRGATGAGTTGAGTTGVGAGTTGTGVGTGGMTTRPGGAPTGATADPNPPASTV